MIPRRKAYILKGEFWASIWVWFKKSEDPSRYIKGWEDAFARYIGVKYAIAVGSGRSGMELILRSLQLNEGDEVIIPAYTLKDLVGIIASLGLTVIPADIDPKTFNLDPDSVTERITARTKVILATHLFGTPCQIDRILEITKHKSIFVLEDCAHSAGAASNGHKTGSFGDAAFFSFETIKPLNTYGGGMVVTNDEKLATKVRELIIPYRNQARIPLKKIIATYFENWFLSTSFSFPFLYLLASKYFNKKMYNFYRRTQRLSTARYSFTDFQAFVGLEKLKTLEKRIASRREKADLLKSLLDTKIIPQQIDEKITPNYYFFVALFPFNISKIRRFLLMRGIDAGIGAEIADDCGSFLKRVDCPNVKKVFQRSIQLPLHEGVTNSNICYIANALNSIFKNENTFDRPAIQD